MDKEEYEKVIQGRIKSLKDVIEVLFETEQDPKDRRVRWICPVTSETTWAECQGGLSRSLRPRLLSRSHQGDEK